MPEPHSTLGTTYSSLREGPFQASRAKMERGRGEQQSGLSQSVRRSLVRRHRSRLLFRDLRSDV
eukprot:3356436-Rhodomonas_salina.2